MNPTLFFIFLLAAGFRLCPTVLVKFVIAKRVPKIPTDIYESEMPYFIRFRNYKNQRYGDFGNQPLVPTWD